MKTTKTYLLNICFIVTLIYSCQTKTDSDNPGQVNDQDSFTVVSKKDTLSLFNSLQTNKENTPKTNFLLIDDDYINTKIILLDNDTIADTLQQYHLDRFTQKQQNQTLFKYYLSDTLTLGSDFKSYIIIEYIDSEISSWLVNYSKEGDLIGAFQVYYNNTEGCWTTQSKIDGKESTIQVKSYDCYAEPEETTSKYLITSEGRVLKIETEPTK